MAQIEDWRPVVGFEKLYEVSDLGRVRSLGRTVVCGSRWGTERRMTFQPKLLKPYIGNKSRSPIGYLGVTLTRGITPSDGRRHLIHHLVLKAFRGPRPHLHEGAHCNGQHFENQLSNLQWKTPKENHLDAVAHGTHVRSSHSGRMTKVYT